MKRFEAGTRGKIFDEALGACGVEKTPERIGQLVELYRAHVPTLRLQPDAEEVLAWGSDKFRFAVISDGPLVSQQNKVRAVALERQIAQILLTDAWGREFWKPSPRAFLEVMKSNGGEVSGYVYVADNPRKDFIAPRELGWRTVRLRRPGGEHAKVDGEGVEAEGAITDLRELMTLLAPIDGAQYIRGAHERR
jgi:putative hydrolase of the HAD superfamily